jgi:hypothetical protein
MGLVRPQWIAKDWFVQCPFNYCDHFGDQEVLATVCKICKEELDRKKVYQAAGKDPYKFEFVLQDLHKNFTQTMELLQKGANKWGIDLENLPEVDEQEPPEPETYLISNIIWKYRDHVQKTINRLQLVPIETNQRLIEKVIDALAHSRHYIIVKVRRALDSRWGDADDPILQENHDDKTSALFAYMAIERNSRALLALARHKPLRDVKEKHLKFASVSLEIAEMIREEFFPEFDGKYEEFGCDSYNKLFR